MFVWNHMWLWKDYHRIDDPHFCSRCGTQLGKERRAEVLPQGSELREILNRSYNVIDKYRGKAKYHWTAFRCTTCGKWYNIDDIKKMEEEY